MPRLPRVTLFVSMLVSVFALQGCLAGTHHGHYHSHHSHGRSNAAVAAIGLIAGAAVLAAEVEHHSRREPERVYYYNVVYANQEAPTPASPRDRVASNESALPGFDAKRARAALGSVDLSACRAEGAPRGYGHATVTFNPDGGASKVVVDTPSGLGDPAVECIGDRLGAVTVPEYKGSLVSVGTTWFVP